MLFGTVYIQMFYTIKILYLNTCPFVSGRLGENIQQTTANCAGWCMACCHKPTERPRDHSPCTLEKTRIQAPLHLYCCWREKKDPPPTPVLVQILIRAPTAYSMR